MREILICLGVTVSCAVLVLFARFNNTPDALADSKSPSQSPTQTVAMNTGKPTTAAPAAATPSTSSTSKKMTEITTPSGLKYVDVKVGEGENPKVGQSIKVKYAGTLENGQKFDSGTFDFNIGTGQVIKGWDEGLLTMKVGGSRKLIIPPDLAYGSRSPGAGIPPNATLLFDVELLKIN